MKPLAYYLDPAQRDLRLYGSGEEEVANFRVKWQDGPLDENNVNGVLPEDVLLVVRDRLAELNQKPYNTREGSLAITAVEEAMGWLLRRRINRADAGTLGTSQP